ncbi:MAG: hypothetical protein ACE5JG_00595 [Planctomycetota bacterium]
MRFGLVLLLLASAPELHELRYRFPKGLVYEETTTRTLLLEGEEKGAPAVWKMSAEETFRRTIVEADGTRHPSIERVEVLKMVRTVEESPTEEKGRKVDPAQGRTFLWRRRPERWKLYDGKGEVTKRYPRLVERLSNWRDARLPKIPVRVGATWEVSARIFLETLGQPPPPRLDGLARFKLEEVREGTARISFDVVYRWRQGETDMSAEGKGIWRFDVRRGRDLELEVSVAVAAGKLKGTSRQRRVVKYPG